MIFIILLELTKSST